MLCPAVEEEEVGEGRAEEQEEEAREVRSPPTPETPSEEQVRQHRLTHTPFRSWCPHCVKGKGREDHHTKSRQNDVYMGIPKLASDYFFYRAPTAHRKGGASP